MRKGKEGRGAHKEEEENLFLPSIPVPEGTRVFLAGRLHPFQIQNHRNFV